MAEKGRNIRKTENVGASDEETRRTWNRIAGDWLIQVGDEGDRNRRLNSDPVLWRFAGDVNGLDVLDAGCGTGYLARKLQDRGAHVVGCDFAEEMIAIARRRYPGIEFQVDSCERLDRFASDRFDLVAANYVLMDLRDLEGAAVAFHRVLKPGGVAICIFSHPCFPASWAEDDEDGLGVRYHWRLPYFRRHRVVDPPWAHFTSEFIWFHRPLSDYWKAFRHAGFDLVDFEEPRVPPDRFHLLADDRQRLRSQLRPYSVAFKLRKPYRPDEAKR